MNTEMSTGLPADAGLMGSPTAVAPVAPTPMSMLSMAVQQGADIDKLAKLMELQERWEANEARKSFNVAFSEFKNEAVKIVKSTEVKDGPLKGKFHANLFDVVNATTPFLSKHGLTISWKLSKDDPGWMEVTCTLRHVGGHSESVSMGAAPDAGPGRNAIQARGSAKSYLERYTATAILGLAPQDADSDGNTGSEGLSEKEVADFTAAIDEKIDSESLSKLWAVIAARCHEAYDRDSHASLKAKVEARAKVIKAKK